MVVWWEAVANRLLSDLGVFAERDKYQHLIFVTKE
jgi:hypothetical protein